jgi:carbon storage regulator
MKSKFVELPDGDAMLVLTRRKGEQLVISLGEETILVRVIEINRNRVRLGIVAPSNVPVHREEVARRMELENDVEAYLIRAEGAES